MLTPLETRRIILKAVSEIDNQTLFQWRNQSDFLKMVASKRTLVSFDEFLQEQKIAFKTGRHSQFIIWTKNEHQVAIGTIYVFSLNLIDGHAFVNLFLDEKWRRKGIGPEAGVVVSRYLFDFFPLFKIYFDAFGYNLPSISVMEKMGLEKEGTFKGHRFFDGQRYDVLRFALHRDNLEKINKLVKYFQSRHS